MQLSTLFLGGRYDTMTSYFSAGMLDFIFAASTEITQIFPAGGELWFFLAGKRKTGHLPVADNIIYPLFRSVAGPDTQGQK